MTFRHFWHLPRSVQDTKTPRNRTNRPERSPAKGGHNTWTLKVPCMWRYGPWSWPESSKYVNHPPGFKWWYPEFTGGIYPILSRSIRNWSFKAFDLARLMASSTCNFHGTKRKTRESLELFSSFFQLRGGEWLNGWMVGEVWSGRCDAQVVSPSHYVVMWSSREKSGKLRRLSAFRQTSILQFRCLELSQKRGSSGKSLSMHGCIAQPGPCHHELVATW